MKNIVLLAVGLLLFSVAANAQLLSGGDFSGTGPITTFEKSNDSGYGLDSLFRTADPSNASNTVMAVHLTFDGPIADTTTNLHGRFDYGNTVSGPTYVPTNGAHFVTFWVYLDSTQNIPDSLGLTVYAMDNTNWQWYDYITLAKDIPKSVWFPMSFPLYQRHALNPSFVIASGGVQTGMQFQPNGQKWHGTIYVDNAELVGTLPKYLQGGQFTSSGQITTFEKGNDSGYGLDSVFRTADPTNPANGVMGIHFTFDDAIADTTPNLHGRFDFGNTVSGATYIPAGGAQAVVFWVYLDSAQHIPDSLTLTTYAMDNTNWQWYDYKTLVKDLPKSVWYPMYFPLSARHALNSSFVISSGGFTTGMQFQPQLDTSNLVVDSSKWHGIIYVDNVALLDTVVALPPIVWNAATFENSQKRGFYVPPLGAGHLSVVLDNNTSNASYVLQAAVQLAQAAHKFTMLRDSIPMHSGVSDSAATSVSLDFWIPSNIPVGGYMKLYLDDGTHDSVAVVDTIKASMRNAWTTITLAKLDSLETAGVFDRTVPAMLGVQLSYSGDTATWSGNVWFDNLVIRGEHFSSELGDIATGVADNGGLIKVYKLYNNYPNPFNPSTIIRYDLPKQSKVVLKVYNVLGQEVETLVNEVKAAGSYEATFKASRLASGVYFYRLTAGSYVKSEKMLLLK